MTVDAEILALSLVFLLVVAPALTRALRGRPRSTMRAEPPKPAGRPSPAPPVGEIVGRAYVIDGDTIMIGGRKIRLAGIDAPELDRPFGRKSKWAMVEICKGQTVTARLNGARSHDRLVGTCYLPDGRDIGAELIRRGLALDWTFHSGGKYRHLEPPGARARLHNQKARR